VEARPWRHDPRRPDAREHLHRHTVTIDSSNGFS
jgi:hypothetical protein